MTNLNNDGPYWVESVKNKDDEDMTTIKLSCENHGACITIHGGKVKATNRALAILQTMNKEG